MKTAKAFLNGSELLQCVYLADSFFKRLKGLLFTKGLDPSAGLLLKPCSQIHTIGMGYPIDAVYIDKDGKVVKKDGDIAPGRMLPFVKGCRQVLEFAAGASQPVRIGDTITIK